MKNKRLACFAIMAVLLLTGVCAMTALSRGSPDSKPAPVGEIIPRDVAVIDAAMAYLLDSPDLPGKKRPGAIALLLPDDPGPVAGFERDSLPYGTKEWADFPREAWTDLIRRSDGPAVPASVVWRRFEAYRFSERIRVTAIPHYISGMRGTRVARDGQPGFLLFEDDYPSARFWILVHAPGYSSDGRFALLCGEIGPSPHGATVAMLFEYRDGAWRVLHCRPAYYA